MHGWIGLKVARRFDGTQSFSLPPPSTHLSDEVVTALTDGMLFAPMKEEVQT